jgi:hypothetical protein
VRLPLELRWQKKLKNKEVVMKSKWIEYNGKKILYQDFSNHFFDTNAVKAELEQVESIVLGEPEDSVLVISNFTNTEITNILMPILNEASRVTKSHVHKTAAIGVTGMKRTLGDLLSRITGQPLMYFTNEVEAKEWLIK